MLTAVEESGLCFILARAGLFLMLSAKFPRKRDAFSRTSHAISTVGEECQFPAREAMSIASHLVEEFLHSAPHRRGHGSLRCRTSTRLF